MNFTATAPVPAANRLIDADTTDLAAIRRDAAAAGFPMNPPYTATTAVTPVVALSSDEGKGVTADATAAEDLALIQAALAANPAAVRELADAIRRSGGLDFKEGYAHGYVDGMQRALAARPAGCPSYCTEDHRAHVDMVDGFSIGLGHEVVVTDLTADDAASTVAPATARVLVESTTERGEVITPTRVVLTLAEGVEGQYAGTQDTQGWSGTPAEVEQLAHALLSAARIARHA
jgi:hypothetical protein